MPSDLSQMPTADSTLRDWLWRAGSLRVEV